MGVFRFAIPRTVVRDFALVGIGAPRDGCGPSLGYVALRKYVGAGTRDLLTAWLCRRQTDGREGLVRDLKDANGGWPASPILQKHTAAP
jgi:hypothetical protein